MVGSIGGGTQPHNFYKHRRRHHVSCSASLQARPPRVLQHRRDATMAEALGVAASAIQLADFGVQLSTSLYSYIETVSSADRRLTEVATKVQLTTAVIQEVGLIFDAPEIVALRKETAVTTAKSTLRECSGVFKEIEDAVLKSRKNKYLFPFRAPKIAALSASLESLKSNLSLLLHVLQHAHRIASDEKARKETEDRIRERDEALRALSKRLSSDGDSSKSLPPYEPGQGAGAFVALHQQFPEQKPARDSDSEKEDEMEVEYPDAERTAGQITTEDLASCVDGLKQLIQHIQHLQNNISAGAPAPAARDGLLATYSGVKRTLDGVLPAYDPPKETTRKLLYTAEYSTTSRNESTTEALRPTSKRIRTDPLSNTPPTHPDTSSSWTPLGPPVLAGLPNPTPEHDMPQNPVSAPPTYFAPPRRPREVEFDDGISEEETEGIVMDAFYGDGSGLGALERATGEEVDTRSAGFERCTFEVSFFLLSSVIVGVPYSRNRGVLLRQRLTCLCRLRGMVIRRPWRGRVGGWAGLMTRCRNGGRRSAVDMRVMWRQRLGKGGGMRWMSC